MFRLFPDVIAVAPESGYCLRVTFANDERRRFDMRPYLEYPVFQRLRNPGFFGLARVEYGTVTWPGEIDIEPETLYVEAVPESGDE